MLKRRLMLKRKLYPKREKRDTDTTSKDIPCWPAEIVIMPMKDANCICVGDITIIMPTSRTTY